MFVASVHGHSMEPKISSDSWCLFRKCPAGSREGRILLVQLNAMTDPENGGRYTVKKYHSEKIVSEEEWSHKTIELHPLNPVYPSIPVDQHEVGKLLVIGEFVEVVRGTN